MAMVINGSGTITGLTAGGLPDSTITSAELASNAVTTAKITDANVTQAKLETLVIPLGVGQTWTVVTGSRASGTTYTNSTGRPIFVMITQDVSANGAVTINSTTVADGVASSSSSRTMMTFVVQSGGTYRWNSTFVTWSELR